MKQSQIALIAILMSVFSFTNAALADESVEVKADTKISKPYPTALIERPFTLPAGTVEASASVRFGDFWGKGDKFNDQMASISRMAASFGVTDDFSIGLAWGGMKIHREMKPVKAVDVSFGYFIGANDWFATMASLEVPLHFDRHVVRNVRFAMPTAFNIGVKNLSIMTFHDSLVDFSFARGQYEASFNLPLRVGYQVTPQLWLDASTTLARFETGVARSHKYVWKEPEVRVRGLYAFTSDFDAVVEAGFANAAQPKDTFAFTFGLNYRNNILGA